MFSQFVAISWGRSSFREALSHCKTRYKEKSKTPLSWGEERMQNIAGGGAADVGGTCTITNTHIHTHK